MPDVEPLRFEVEGSKGDLYEIVFERMGDELRATCTCEAGQRGILCRHRFALLIGDCDAVISNNEADLAKIKILAAGTEIESTVDVLANAERALEEAQSVVKRFRAKLGRLLNGPS